MKKITTLQYPMTIKCSQGELIAGYILLKYKFRTFQTEISLPLRWIIALSTIYIFTPIIARLFQKIGRKKLIYLN
jgi:hypothetical protein